MPIRYESTPSDPRELKRDRTAKDRAWQGEAERLLKDSPDFLRWRRWHRLQFFLWASASAGCVTWGMYRTYGRFRLTEAALLLPALAFATVWGIGQMIYSKRCRKNALQNWTKERESVAPRNA